METESGARISSPGASRNARVAAGDWLQQAVIMPAASPKF
jgi:hypothetical protein